jgi:hypothetical protein
MTYLGAQIKEFRHPNDPLTSMWSLSADHYIKNALANHDFNLQKMGKWLPTKVSSPLSSNYRPELDITPYLDDVTFLDPLVATLCGRKVGRGSNLFYLLILLCKDNPRAMTSGQW